VGLDRSIEDTQDSARAGSEMSHTSAVQSFE
jgi:hypothetical protein